MKSFLLLLFILACTALQARAQEFRLHVNYIANGTTYAQSVYFGYDAEASDQIEPSKWPTPDYPEGEQFVPSDNFSDRDIRNGGIGVNRPYLETGCYVDIRNKPALDSFQLKFEIDIIARGLNTAKIVWDKSLIPPIVKHIYLASSIFPSQFRLDMKQVSEFDIPVKDSATKYDKMVLTLLYNKELAAVRGGEVSSERTMIYPTVNESGQKQYLWLEAQHPVIISMTDMLGRVVSRFSVSGVAGANELPQVNENLQSGLYFAEVVDSVNGQILARQKLLIQ